MRQRELAQTNARTRQAQERGRRVEDRVGFLEELGGARKFAGLERLVRLEEQCARSIALTLDRLRRHASA